MQKITKLEAVFQMISKYSQQVKIYINLNKLIKQLEENEPPESVANNILKKFKNIINK